MTTHRRRRLRTYTAEQLLRGRPVGPLASRDANRDALTDLITAAAAPARASELGGEQEAVAAFRVARLTPATQLRRPSMIKTGMAKLLTLKIALAAAGALAAGGVALTAGTGHIPSQFGGTSANSHASTHASTHSDAARPAAHPNASPSPSLRGLCSAYTAGVSTSHGKALDNPAFTALITAAGGKDNVAKFCAAMLGSKPGQSHATHPTGPPATHPAGPPATHPAGKPTSQPAT